MKYTIYQIRIPKTVDEENIFTKYAYRSYDSIDKINFDLYDNIYSGEINTSDDPIVVLEDLFKIFNIKHPKDYKGRSLSVSDIVKLDNKYYYCDSLGWTNVKI